MSKTTKTLEAFVEVKIPREYLQNPVHVSLIRSRKRHYFGFTVPGTGSIYRVKQSSLIELEGWGYKGIPLGSEYPEFGYDVYFSK